MSVSAELLCSFELLKPLDSSALKNHIKKGRNKRQSMLNSPVRHGSIFAVAFGVSICYLIAIYLIYFTDLFAYTSPQTNTPKVTNRDSKV